MEWTYLLSGELLLRKRAGRSPALQGGLHSRRRCRRRSRLGRRRQQRARESDPGGVVMRKILNGLETHPPGGGGGGVPWLRSRLEGDISPVQFLYHGWLELVTSLLCECVQIALHKVNLKLAPTFGGTKSTYISE